MHCLRPVHRIALALALLASACGAPPLGDKKVPPAPPITTPRLTLTGAAVNGDGKVVVQYTLLQGASPIAAADAALLRPTFTVGALDLDPVSGLRAWRSLLFTGSQTIPSNPLGGPGTPPALVAASRKQPGSESAGAVADLGGGAYSYTFVNALPAGHDPALTLRVGGWLNGVTTGTADTAATLDFVPAGGTPERRELVVDADCNHCHPLVLAHGRRSGVKLCLICHTQQNADPDTQDPAAMNRALTVSPQARTVVAGTGATTLAASLLWSTATVTWSLAPAGVGTLSAASGAAVDYTPPASVAAPTTVTLTARAAQAASATTGNGGFTFTFPVTLTVLPAAATAPPLQVNPPVQTVVAQVGAAALPLKATLTGLTGTVAWTLSPAGTGTLSATTGASVTWTPPTRVTAPVAVTVTATVGAETAAAAIDLQPGIPGSATPGTNPNPLDFGRLVHRIHRGKNLPTNYASSSLAAAPDVVPGATLPPPFRPGSAANPALSGRSYAIVGFQSRVFAPGEVKTWTTPRGTSQVAAGGIFFPRDLRDCGVCHDQAADRIEIHDAISRRTCGGCHPDVWFQDTATAPITDQVHFAHTGGPKADDTACSACHRAAVSPAAPVDTVDAHQPPVTGDRFNTLTVTILGVKGLLPAIPGAAATDPATPQYPTVVFTVSDRDGPIELINSATPLAKPTSAFSPVARKLNRLAFQLAGPTTDYLNQNVAVTETVAFSSATVTTPELVADAQGRFTYTFKSAALPATASGSWTIGAEARRQFSSTPNFNKAAGTFSWPYTGESLTEAAGNVQASVDVAARALGLDPDTMLPATSQGTPVARRQVVETARCNRCHGRLWFHGGNRNETQQCVLCHTADGTDWSRRPKVNGNVDLAATLDGVEERSIHFKVMIHRIHTGEATGTAQIDLQPLVISGVLLGEGGFPGRLADCRNCHVGESFTVEAVPADAAPTVANETASVQHAATAAHAASETRLLPITASCISCHDTGTARVHASSYQADGKETCVSCHGGRGALSVYTLHGVDAPAP